MLASHLFRFLNNFNILAWLALVDRFPSTWIMVVGFLEKEEFWDMDHNLCTSISIGHIWISWPPLKSLQGNLRFCLIYIGFSTIPTFPTWILVCFLSPTLNCSGWFLSPNMTCSGWFHVSSMIFIDQRLIIEMNHSGYVQVHRVIPKDRKPRASTHTNKSQINTPMFWHG